MKSNNDFVGIYRGDKAASLDGRSRRARNNFIRNIKLGEVHNDDIVLHEDITIIT